MDHEVFLNKQFVMTDTLRIDKVKDLYTTFNPHVNLEALKQGGYLEALAEMMEPVLMNYDEPNLCGWFLVWWIYVQFPRQ